jgi:hypothetical protein
MILEQFARNADLGGAASQGFAARPTGFAEDFRAMFDVGLSPARSAPLLDQERSRRYADATEKYSTATGRTLKNPFQLSTGYVDQVLNGRAQDPLMQEALNSLGELDRLNYDNVLGAYRKIVDRELLSARLLHPVIPDPAEFDSHIGAEVRRREETAAKAMAGASVMGKVGGFMGEMVGTMLTPEQAALTVLTLPVGGVGGSFARTAIGRILGTAAIEGGLGAGQQAIVEALNYRTPEKIGLPTPTDAEIAERILYAGAGGAVLGGGLRAGAEVAPYVWPGLRAAVNRASGRRLPSAGRDALLALDSELQVATTGPGRGLDKHAKAVESAMQSVVNGEKHKASRPLGDPALDPNIYGRAKKLAEATGGELTTAQIQRQLGVGYPEARRILNRLQREDLAGLAGGGSSVKPMNEKRANVFTPAGRAVEVEYEVVEADSLLASHGRDLEPDPAYPVELQPRDRGRAASAVQIHEIASGLEPERLTTGSDAGTGAPIVGPDDVVESGNGRLLAIRQAYEGVPASAARYRAHLAGLGFKVEGMRRPVLVRRRITPLSPEERISYVREANLSQVSSLSSVERAMTDAKLLGERVLDLYQGGDVELVGNRPFVRAFVDSLPQAEHAAMMQAGGDLSRQGADRIRAAMLAKAYGEPELLGKLLEATDTNIAAIGKALTDIAPAWAQMRARAARGEIVTSIVATADLLAAVRTVERARHQGLSVADWLSQGQMFDGGISENAKGFLRALFNDVELRKPSGRERIAERLGAYVTEANKTVPGPNLFGDAPAAPSDILAAPSISYRSTAEVQSEALAEAAKPATDDAMAVEAARLLDERDIQIPVSEVIENGQRRAVTKSAREVIADMERQMTEMDEIASCAIGLAAE